MKDEEAPDADVPALPDGASARGGDSASCAPFEALVAALGTPALSAEDEARARAHLLGCERCREVARLFHAPGSGAAGDEGDDDDPEGPDPSPGEASPDDRRATGEIVAGRYRLDHLLGSGGMGIVWSATQTVTGQAVAIKFLRADGARSRRRLVREARAAAAVRHPNVVRILDVVELDAGAPALVMERLVGRTLQRLFDEGPVPLGALCSILRRVADALAAAHAAGVVHRDVKPENVFLARGAAGDAGETEVRLVDFGIAKRTGLERSMASGTLTHPGALVGTPFYMAPEQVLGEDDVDFRADLWALGLLLYQGLSGWLPTRADNLGQVLKAIALSPVPPIETRVPDLPEDVAALAGRLLSKARADRLGLDEVRSVLARHEAPGLGAAISSTDAMSAPLAARPGPSPVRPAPAPARRPSPARRRTAAVALGALALAGGVALTVAGWRARSRSRGLPSSAAPPGVASSPCPDDMVLIESQRGPMEPYCMDRTEVTAGAYRACVVAGMCEPASTVEVSRHRPKHIGRAAKCNYGVPGREEHPINCLTWRAALTYCQSVRKRLPTVDEWRWAAQGGSNGYLYPWGTEPPTDAQVCWRGAETCAVGTHPAGATANGLMDLAGNVWEVMSTPGREPGSHVACGGGFYEETAPDVLSARCGFGWDDESFHDSGFRCAR